MKIIEFIWNNGRFHKTLVTEKGGEWLKSLQSMDIEKAKYLKSFVLKNIKISELEEMVSINSRAMRNVCFYITYYFKIQLNMFHYRI